MPSKQTRYHRFVLVAQASALALGLFLLFNGDRVFRPGPHDQATQFVIERGDSPRTIAQNLKSKNLIQNENLFNWIVFATRSRNQLKVGLYTSTPRASLFDILTQITSGDATLLRLTIPEGRNLKQALTLIQEAPGLIGALPDDLHEGDIFPDTYFYHYGERRTTLIATMRKLAERTLLRAWRKREDGLPLNTPHDMLVLASIVEKETSLARERRRVAGVFINRLRQNMKLESDPTVTYGITKGQYELDRPLRYSDLRRYSPWNTYRVRGLPPTPICLPGKKALEAVARPLATDELYFVADGSGGHRFAKTFEEHQRNVKRWRQWQKKNQQ
ncbi:MAG: endolytic transglycosylase MltG [Alphaproteobacteria bacterium GM202ARS2]|nr:endolytic transglycosylase MltG [Alphaproteobacteria bacterium GM202ARS2]